MTDQLAYTPDQAAAVAGVPRIHIMSAIHNRTLPARMRSKDSRRYLILRADLEAWLNKLPEA